MTGPIVCLVNRTTHPLTVTKNGRQYLLHPGENHVNSDLVRFAKAQNPLPGSMHPYALTFISLVGVKGRKGEDCSPISDDEIAMMPEELLNRSELPPDRQDVIARRVHFPRGRVGMDGPTAGMIDPGRFGGD